MPTILVLAGHRFFFYSLEGNEPPHVHVERGDDVAKYWLSPVQLAESHGFRSHELNRLRAMVIEHRSTAAPSWRHGMPTLAIRLDSTAVDVRADDVLLHVTLADGRELAAPLEWFPRLRDASPEQRSHWRLIGRGQPPLLRLPRPL